MTTKNEYRVLVLVKGILNKQFFDSVEEALEAGHASIIHDEPCYVAVSGPKGRIWSYELPIKNMRS